MAKRELLEIVESFIQSHQGDNLLLDSVRKSIDDLFKQYITPKRFEDYTLAELYDMKDKLLKGINSRVIQSINGVREKMIDRLEKVNTRIEDLS